MRYLISIHHPAQVHFFKHVIEELREEGHEVRVCAREKDVAIDLLEAYDIPYRALAGPTDGLADLAVTQLRYEYRLLREARRFRPDVMTSIGGLEISHVAPLVGARSVAFNDSEGTPSHKIMTPFLDAICTPRQFAGDFGAGHRRYDGYHELAYLHPDRFEPEPDRLRPHGIEPDDRYFVLRFVSWSAHHDVGQQGLSRDAKRELVSALDEMGAVYITNEGTLPAEFDEYRTPVPPHLVHDLLSGADLYVGDSQTMATEAAILGTPAVRSNSFAGDDDMSNFVELEEEYGLLHSIPDEDEAVETALALASAPDVRAKWRERRERLLEDKIDVTAYALDVLREEGRNARRGTGQPRGVLDRLDALVPGGDSE